MFKIKQKIVFGLLLMSTAMIFMNYQVKAVMEKQYLINRH